MIFDVVTPRVARMTCLQYDNYIIAEQRARACDIRIAALFVSSRHLERLLAALIAQNIFAS